MVQLWFLVITLCPLGNANECQDFIIDGELSYSDCLAEMPKQQPKNEIYAVACMRGERVEGSK